jgi:aminomethyltransferase
LANERAVGVRRKLCGIRTTGRRPPRDGARVMVDGVDSGVVTSGNFSPVLGAGIAFALLTPEATQVGRSVLVKVRDSELPGTVVATPFVIAPK